MSETSKNGAGFKQIQKHFFFVNFGPVAYQPGGSILGIRGGAQRRRPQADVKACFGLPSLLRVIKAKHQGRPAPLTARGQKYNVLAWTGHQIGPVEV